MAMPSRSQRRVHDAAVEQGDEADDRQHDAALAADPGVLRVSDEAKAR